MRRLILISLLCLAGCDLSCAVQQASTPKPLHKLGAADDFSFPHPVTWGPQTVAINGLQCLNLDAGVPVSSDFIQGGTETFKYTCRVLSMYNGTNLGSNVNISGGLIGSCDSSPNIDGGTWVDAGPAFPLATAADGGVATFGLAQGNYQVYPAEALQLTLDNSDGGYLCCYAVAL
jgi:hypothetical protein